MQSPENLQMIMKHPGPSSSQAVKPATKPGKWTVRWAAPTRGPGGKFCPSASLEWASSSGAFSGERQRSMSLWRKTSMDIYQDCCLMKNRKSASKTNPHSGLKGTFSIWNVYLFFSNAFRRISFFLQTENYQIDRPHSVLLKVAVLNWIICSWIYIEDFKASSVVLKS